MLSEKKIKEEYKEFDNFYEENEIPPYNAAFDYFRAGVKIGEQYSQVTEDTEVTFIDAVGSCKTLKIKDLVNIFNSAVAFSLCNEYGKIV